jgi:secreted Zn-dependent insulinase-like peptidase
MNSKPHIYQYIALIRHDEQAEVWFKQDDFFKQPKVNFIISLHTPLAYATAKSCGIN